MSKNKDEQKTFYKTVLNCYATLGPRKRAVFWSLSIIGVLLLSYLIFALSYLGETYPRVIIAGKNYAGFTEKEISNDLAKRFEALKTSSLYFTFADKTYEIKTKDLVLTINSAEAARNAYAVGRNRQVLAGFYDQVRTLIVGKTIDSTVNFDEQNLKNKLSEVTDQIDRPAENASGRFENTKLVVSKEKTGERVNEQKMLLQITADIRRLSPGSYLLALEKDLPTIVLGDLAVLESMVGELEKTDLTLVWSGSRKRLASNDIRLMIDFVGDPTSVTTPRVLTARFTKERIVAFLAVLGETVNEPAKEPKLGIKNGLLSVLENSKEGKVIDLDLSSEAILETLLSVKSINEVELIFKTALPVIVEERLDELGITERIGYGETSFAGSPANRRHNITVGVSLLQSALIAPGQEFSTVGKLGAVNASTGFLPELVIKDNRTIPEYGGGLCQVSTTLFRSVINAGLNVVERRNHSYRVGYYEPPIGLDATIYLPKPDFRFLNDTPNHILIQGRVQGNKVIFELWGKNDGRISSVSNPEVLSTTPAGNPIYSETDTLLKGEVKQIEKAHDGATTVAYYTVVRNGQVIHKQTFKSVYKAWPARFLVGTKEPIPPPAEPT